MPLFETSYIPSQGRLTPLQKPLLFDLTFRNAIISTMLVALIPLLMLAASLHESLFDSLGYQSAAGVSGMISYFFAGSTVSQFYHGTVTFVELRVNACEIKSLSFTSYYRPSLRLDDDSLSFLNRSITASHSGLGEQSAVSGQHMTASYKLEPTRPSAAAAPVQGWGARQRIEGCPTHVPLATPALVPAPNVETPESGVIVPLLLTMGVDSTTLAPSLAVLPPTPIAASLDVLVPTPLPTVTPASQQALSSLLATHPSGELAFNTSPNSIILVHVIRVDPLVGGIVSKLPFPAPAHDFKPEEYTVATSHVVVATSIVISTSAPSTPPHQPTVVPVLTKHEQVDSSWTWMSRYGWVLIWTVPLALQVGIAVGLYLNQRRPVQCCRQDAEVSDVLKILRLLRELGDFPHIIDEYDITPGELRSYIDMIVETRQSASGQSTAEPSVNEPDPGSPRNSSSRQESSSSVGPTHAPSLSTPRQVRSTNPTPRKSHLFPFIHLIYPQVFTGTDDSLAAVFARAAALQKGIIDQGERFERRFDEIWAAIGSPPRREESRREELSEEELGGGELGEDEGEMPAAGASGSVERRKTDMRALANVSPLAHRTLKRASERTTNGALPTPEPSGGRTWTQTTEPRAGDHWTEATNDLENTWSVSFNPVAASSPVRATGGDGRNGISEGLDIRSMSFNPIGTSSPVRAQGSRTPVNQSTSYQVRQERISHEGMSPDSTDSTLSVSSHQDPSLVREPLPPATNSYALFGTLAHLYIPRPQAPEPDTTLDSSVEKSSEE
ncbi:hypothetical protein FRC09_007220 [Ceratobasidium sp. 395]|nr:hypothetical protein FRC09_007220 [Ceratobasidium sp. 395]